MRKKTKKLAVVINLQVEGFHFWAQATGEDEHLERNHRHMFHIQLHVPVTATNRQVEIIRHKRKVMNLIFAQFGRPCLFGNSSCEDIANWILESTSPRPSKVQVLEDGENGAVIESL